MNDVESGRIVLDGWEGIAEKVRAFDFEGAGYAALKLRNQGSEPQLGRLDLTLEECRAVLGDNLTPDDFADTSEASEEVVTKRRALLWWARDLAESNSVGVAVPQTFRLQVYVPKGGRSLISGSFSGLDRRAGEASVMAPLEFAPDMEASDIDNMSQLDVAKLWSHFGRLVLQQVRMLLELQGRTAAQAHGMLLEQRSHNERLYSAMLAERSKQAEAEANMSGEQREAAEKRRLVETALGRLGDTAQTFMRELMGGSGGMGELLDVISADPTLTELLKSPETVAMLKDKDNRAMLATVLQAGVDESKAEEANPDASEHKKAS